MRKLTRVSELDMTISCRSSRRWPIQQGVSRWSGWVVAVAPRDSVETVNNESLGSCIDEERSKHAR
jgi:hypothetical protein